MQNVQIGDMAAVQGVSEEKIPVPNLKLLEFRNQIKCKKEWLSGLRKWH